MKKVEIFENSGGREGMANSEKLALVLGLLSMIVLLTGCSAPANEQNGLSKATENISAPNIVPSANSGQEGSKPSIFVEKCAGKGLSDENLIFSCLSIEDTNNLTVADCVSLDVNNFMDECPGSKKNTCSFFLAMGKNKCIHELAKAKKDISICKALEGINVEACEADVSGKSEEFAVKQFGKLEEIQGLAVKQNDENVCKQLGGGLFYEVCIEKVAVKKKDPSLCDSFKYGNPAICKLEIEKEIKKSEVEERALRLDDENVCSEIPQIGLAELCVTKVAVKRKDATLCGTLQFGADLCRAEVKMEVKK